MKLKVWLKANRNIFFDNDLRFLIKTSLSKPLSSALEEEAFLNEEKLSSLEEIKRSYLKGFPLAYILGKEEFYGLEFKVSPAVLIPRKETELIVEKCIDVIRDNQCESILDLCCGCGNIAISIKKTVMDSLSCQDWIPAFAGMTAEVEVFAADISLEALDLARKNSEFHKTNIKFIHTDLFQSLGKKKFDLIVSNPPYVEDSNVAGSLEYEPRIAIAAGNDGLYFIKKILDQAHAYLREEGILVMEMGYNHKDAVEEMVESVGQYSILDWIKDYSGHWRGIVLKLSMKS
jgi:release factor glutamine methyltransferase